MNCRDEVPWTGGGGARAGFLVLQFLVFGHDLWLVMAVETAGDTSDKPIPWHGRVYFLSKTIEAYLMKNDEKLTLFLRNWLNMILYAQSKIVVESTLSASCFRKQSKLIPWGTWQGRVRGNGAHVTVPCDVIPRKRNGRLLREISLVARFPHRVNSIFFILTLTVNLTRWTTHRDEETKYWSFETQKTFKTFSHHRIDIWKVKVEMLCQ